MSSGAFRGVIIIRIVNYNFVALASRLSHCRICWCSWPRDTASMLLWRQREFSCVTFCNNDYRIRSHFLTFLDVSPLQAARNRTNGPTVTWSTPILSWLTASHPIHLSRCMIASYRCSCMIGSRIKRYRTQYTEFISGRTNLQAKTNKDRQADRNTNYRQQDRICNR